jgi:hypothetical protein
MLIVNDDHLRRAGRVSLDHCCPYCGEAFAMYPLIMSDDPGQTVYHAACALELATDLLVDLFTFFHPPAPYTRLFTLCPEEADQDMQTGGSDAVNES